MFTALGLMLTGMLLGRLLREQTWLPCLPRYISPVIMLMLFCLGVAVGGNTMLMDHLLLMGSKALLLTVGGVTGSLVCVALIRPFFHMHTSAGSASQKKSDGDETRHHREEV
ncbi:MAG: LysO family transporter [Desulfovibrio sp.]|nr:LysO family transporter [Desulfovibrio sp.]